MYVGLVNYIVAGKGLFIDELGLTLYKLFSHGKRDELLFSYIY